MTNAPADATPLVLLNGITRTSESWSALRKFLPSVETLAFDRAGHTLASIPQQARDVLAALDAADIEHADVVGFSHGGLIAQQLAHVAPERVRKLVLLATSCGSGATTPGLTMRPGPMLRTLDTDIHDARTIAAQLWAVSTWSSIPFLGSLSMPTLVVHGLHDRLVPVANARVLARRIPGARLVLLETGHDLQRADRAPVVAAEIVAFRKQP